MINPSRVLLRTEPGETDFQLLRASPDSVTEFALTTIRGVTRGPQAALHAAKIHVLACNQSRYEFNVSTRN
jgi:hypothetical protein